MIAVIVLVSMALCFLGYRIYGPWLARRFALDDSCPTPAVVTVMILAPGGSGEAEPNMVYAGGIARTGRQALFAIIPMLFMMAMAVWSLVLLIVPFVSALPAIVAGEGASPDLIVSGGVGTVLFVMTARLVVEAARILLRPQPPPASS